MATHQDVIEDKLKIRAISILKKFAELRGVTVNLIKHDKYTDVYDQVYGSVSGRATEVIIKSTKKAPFVFPSNFTVLTLSVDGSDYKDITMNPGVQFLSSVMGLINIKFPNLAKSKGTDNLYLEAQESISISSSSTAISWLGLPSGIISNSDKINVVITGDEFTPFDSGHIGTMVEGFLYDPTKKVEVGDVIDVIRAGNRIRQFKVMQAESVGSTIDVLHRFRISAIVK